MAAEVDWSHDTYVKIRISGLLTKPGLIGIMSEILQHPDYTRKHTFWDLRQGKMGLSITDLKEIVGVLRLYRPETEHFADRAALLVSGKMNDAMAQIFVAMTRLLPIRYRVFNDRKAAETFLLS